MKKLILIYFLLIVTKGHSQIDWKNYSTSFNTAENATLGVAIPYNGIYDNLTGKIVGIAHWNPQDNIYIDAALNDSIPLYFVYDTSGIYFLAPQVNKKNTGEYEYCVLRNNATVVSPWTHINRFTQTEIGSINPEIGMMGPYSAGLGEYLVAHIRNNNGEIIASWVVYWQRRLPEINLLYTSNNPQEFSGVVNRKAVFAEGPGEIGWHRQYNNVGGTQKKGLKLPYNENSIVLDIDAEIYKKEALEYSLVADGQVIRDWAPNEYDNKYLLLKNLDPGAYTIRIRFKRQRNSIREFHFSIGSIWYKTTAFRAVIFTFLVLAGAFFIFLSKYRRQKKALARINEKAEQASGELKNIHALLNPHFTFNALSSIQGLVNKGDLDAANKYLSSFGLLLRETLNESQTDLIALNKELENLEIYMGLEQLRYPFLYNLDTDENIDLFTSTIPPFLLQPFVENAIKHGFSKMNGQGKLHLRIVKNGGIMMIEIIDNGPGFGTGGFKEGYGLGLSRKRIRLLNRDYGEALISLQIESSIEGTSILLVFKNWL
ncbi:sensor histidine kinase [Niabella beijingensis]|uniref:sensor histidine kinase n=1 Tax=Niabella beijingensis TaxID=2872700 RepID=UPI001CBF013E|nr:histidine kinase [Niabella beijingensis]MBZ4188883.1 histidine kinase [Niabella beijingensis]